MPMDIDFIVQDSYALTRPQWKLIKSLDAAGGAFAEAVAQNYKNQDSERTADPEDPEEEPSSEEDAEDDNVRAADMEEARSSSDDAEVEIDTEVCAIGHMVVLSPTC